MCNTVAIKSKPELIQKEYNRRMKDPEKHRTLFAVSGFAHPQLAVITSEEPEIIQHYSWGLIPGWCKSEEQAAEMANMTLNARSESVFEKPSFKTIKKKRCLIPVNGFIEWMEAGKDKYPHFIYLKDRELFSMGGLYDAWMNQETGELISSFSIVTTEANPLMARIHNRKKRMPLMLTKEMEEAWIAKDASEGDIKSMMLPLDESLMMAHPISRRVTSRKEDPNVPETLLPFEYPELALL